MSTSTKNEKVAAVREFCRVFDVELDELVGLIEGNLVSEEEIRGIAHEIQPSSEW